MPTRGRLGLGWFNPSSKGRKTRFKNNEVIDVQPNEEETWTRAIFTVKEKI